MGYCNIVVRPNMARKHCNRLNTVMAEPHVAEGRHEAVVKRGARAERRGGTDVVDKHVCMVRVKFAA